MIKGIGIDLVDIQRFSQWQRYGARLQKVFSQTEIDYCLKNQNLSAARFATRFAAKEAFYKAVSPHLAKKTTFQTICKHCQVSITTTGPSLEVQWERVPLSLSKQSPPRLFLSLTHTATTAGAVVILEG